MDDVHGPGVLCVATLCLFCVSCTVPSTIFHIHAYEATSTQASSPLIKFPCSSVDTKSFGRFSETFRSRHALRATERSASNPAHLLSVQGLSLFPLPRWLKIHHPCGLVADAAHQRAPFVCGHVQVILCPALAGLVLLATHHPTGFPLHLPWVIQARPHLHVEDMPAMKI